MSGAQNVPGVAVRVPVVADSAQGVEAVGRGDCRCLTMEEESGAREKSAVEEVAARDQLVHAEAIGVVVLDGAQSSTRIVGLVAFGGRSITILRLTCPDCSEILGPL